MAPANEIAFFSPIDEPCLVAASLACSVCLSGKIDWAMRGGDDWEPAVLCTCRSCGHTRTVHLTGDQALRLALDRPELDRLGLVRA